MREDPRINKENLPQARLSATALVTPLSCTFSSTTPVLPLRTYELGGAVKKAVPTLMKDESMMEVEPMLPFSLALVFRLEGFESPRLSCRS
jgi:hypothetical protein